MKVLRWIQVAAAAGLIGCVWMRSAQADGAASITDVPPTVAATLVSGLPSAQQVTWLRRAAGSGVLERMADAQLVALFQSLDPGALRSYIDGGPNGYGSYEITMYREERIQGKLPGKPDHMLVRIAHDPLRIYAKWLDDGPHAGQELLYDESKRPDEMYGHLGGILNVMSIWSAIDGSMAKRQSRHTVRELGTEYIAKLYLAEGKKYALAGVVRPAHVEVRTTDGVRLLALTWRAPQDGDGFYAHEVTLGLDLRHPWFRSVEASDADGRVIEKIFLQRVEEKNFDATVFDPSNPDYRF